MGWRSDPRLEPQRREKWASLLAQRKRKCLSQGWGTWGATLWGIFKGKSDKSCQAQLSLQSLKSQGSVRGSQWRYLAFAGCKMNFFQPVLQQILSSMSSNSARARIPWRGALFGVDRHSHVELRIEEFFPLYYFLTWLVIFYSSGDSWNKCYLTRIGAGFLCRPVCRWG